MKTPKNLRSHSIIGGLALALALTTAAPSAHANVLSSYGAIHDVLLFYTASARPELRVNQVIAW